MKILNLIKNIINLTPTLMTIGREGWCSKKIAYFNAPYFCNLDPDL